MSMKIYFTVLFLSLIFTSARCINTTCPPNEHMITRLCCNKSCEVVNLAKNARCKWPCAKVLPQCHCNRTFYRHKNGKCVPKSEC